MRLSFAQNQALQAAYDDADTDWIHGNTINWLLKHGLIRWINNSNAYANGRGGYITTPEGRRVAEAHCLFDKQ